MAHIVTCMVETDLEKSAPAASSHITKPPSPGPSNHLVTGTTSVEQQKPHVWRMQQQPEARKYQLFPKDKQQQAPVLGPEQARAYALGQNGEKPSDKDASTTQNGLRIRIKEHTLVRRRKVSVPELGPMTTVQEVAMDSPTIPGRPPLHERSISAPGNSWRQHQVVDMTSFRQDALDENAELEITSPSDGSRQRSASETPRQPMSPKNLAPLVIPTAPQHSFMAGLTRQLSFSRLRAGSTPVESTQRSARTDDTTSPKSRTPFTPLTASTALTTPLSSTTSAPAVSAIPTPVSAPLAETMTSPSTPWQAGTATVLPGSNTADNTPKKDAEVRNPPLGHRRGASESGSIMERGRPRKRTERSDSNVSASAVKRNESKRTRSMEQKLFEELPTGVKISEAVTKFSQADIVALQKQAYGQASRFEIMKKEDVESLSRELRQLDERTEYLRRTYNSLRSGRRNLHSRICQYLRSPRVARFSTDSMLKQEEALAELDASIDDWVIKLEHAENRRSRVRQKLLEHVAAAATLPTSGAASAASESLQQAIGLRSSPNSGVGNISTPPRSPTKCTASRNASMSPSPSPQRVVAQVPSTILEQPQVEESATTAGGLKVAELRRADVESIRVYADSDVYALLADVENEFSKMGVVPQQEEVATPPLSEDAQKEVHRARSHEMLNGVGSPEDKSFLVPPTPTESLAASPPKKEKAILGGGEGIFLTNAVFKP